MSASPTRRRLLAAAAAAAGAAWLPGRAGAATAGEATDESWHDVARGRTLLLRLRLPPRMAPAPWPLVLYSHGLGGGRGGGTVWGEAWAAAGSLVVHLQHPGSDVDVARQGVAALRDAANGRQLLARVADVRFVLDEVERRRQARLAPWVEVDLAAVGVAGHSFGAHTVQALAGQRFPVGPPLADPRPRAFVALSPGALRDDAAFAAVQRPFFALTGSLDADPFGGHAGGEPRARVYDALPPGHKALLWLDGADHATFGGNPGGARWRQRPASAVQREAAHHALVARATALWWQAHLRADAGALQALRGLAGLADGDRLQLG